MCVCVCVGGGGGGGGGEVVTVNGHHTSDSSHYVFIGEF